MSERPVKRVKLLSDDEGSENSSSNVSGGVTIPQKLSTEFKINDEYARRFEHNQKRAELHRLEEKYGAEGSDSSTDEEEDDEGFLASGQLDEEVNATLQALRNKDPKVYDEKTRFYTETDNEALAVDAPAKATDKPMYLRDYHRKALLDGDITSGDESIAKPTYVEEQKGLKDAIVKEIHAAVGASDTDVSSDREGNDDSNAFLVEKGTSLNGNDGDRRKITISHVDVETADKDPETFLSNFLSSRAWVPTTKSKFQAFESEDEEEIRRAEDFEAAYNLRFENPKGANEKLVSHARDTAAKYSVRQESTNKRKRARETEQTNKMAEKSERSQEKARLRRLKIEEAEGKIAKIKDAAGLRGKSLPVEEWSAFLTEDWDDQRWESEMQQKFGNEYYAAREADSSDAENGVAKKKLKKPKWESDIDIDDLVPDFEVHNESIFSLSDEDDNEDREQRSASTHKSKRSKQEREEQKRDARRERRKVEQLVDQKLNIDMALSGTATHGPNRSLFRYRETSPTTYGLTAQEILMASDTQLNQFAGLKKLATFRDVDKKRKDKRYLGKKARLRQWRKETFGHEQGPQKSLQDMLKEATGEPGRISGHGVDQISNGEHNVREGKKRKRSKKSKEQVDVEATT